MSEYFVPSQVPRRWIVGIWAVVCAAVLWGFICLYGTAGAGASLGTAALYVLLLAAGTRAYDYVSGFLATRVARSGLVLMTLVLALGITWCIAILMDWQGFPHLIPLLLLVGGVGWIGLAVLLRNPRPTTEEEAIPTVPEKREPIDRISVKKGQQIHMIRTEELLYVQAEGDYVQLFTTEDRFLKEQTMRYFEERLPDHFVRIHRSSIVNIDSIARVELFGKENYNVRLKNGTVLKASVGGYRLLKMRLNL